MKCFLTLEELSTEQKIGMLLCARYFGPEGDEDLNFTLDLIRNHALGCVQVPFHRPDVMEQILATADYPILIINDTEMGYPKSDLPKVPLMALAACDNEEYYRVFARGVIHDAVKAGYNGTWGPVIDVLRADGPCSVHRHFSDDPVRVAKAAEIIAQVYADNHFLSCGKHYPGGNDPSHDMHMVNVMSDVSKEDIVDVDLYPYRYLMEKGLLPSIMTGHRIYSKIDPEFPATLSKKVNDVIRNLGFDGVCFTDSMAMMAILQQYGEENILGMAIAAGHDIVLPNYRTPTKKSYEWLLQNYRDGVFSEARLNEAVRRTLAAQRMVGTAAAHPTAFTDEDRRAFDDIAKDCITLIADEGVDSALTAGSEDRLFVIVTDNDFEETAETPEIVTGTWYYPQRIAEKIRREFPKADVVFLPEFPNKTENERVLVAATSHKEVVCITYCTTGAYQGTDGLTRRVEYVLNALIRSGKVSAVLHFGNPFAVKTLLHTPRRLFGYMMPQSQLYAIDVLAGKLPAKGTLPFNIQYD